MPHCRRRSRSHTCLHQAVRVAVVLWLVGALALTGLPRIAAAEPSNSGDASAPAQGTWLSGAPAPTARAEVAVATLDGMVYVAGGLEEAGSQDLTPVTVSRAVEVYDPVWNGWSAKAALPQPLHHVGFAALDRHLYVIGGFTKSGVSHWSPVATVYRYNPVSDSWTERQPMPTARGAFALVVVDHKLMAIGGYDGQRNVAAVEVYDPATDSWSAAASLPTPRDHLAAVTIGGDVYAIGGRVLRDAAHNLALVDRYHAATNRWESRASLPVPRSGLAAAVVGERIYVFGGEAPGVTFRDVDLYVPATDRWHSVGTMPTGRHGLGAVALQDRIYLFAGGPKPGATFSNATDIFIPPGAGSTAGGSGARGRASATQVGSVMAILAAWSEAGILPPESTPDASRIVKALIQFQGALMKSGNRHVTDFFERAFAQKFGSAAEQQLRQGRRDGWTSRNLEAVLDYATGPAHWDQAGLDAGWREFNVGSQDLRLLASLHQAAKAELAAEGKDLHAVYESKRRLMPGAP